MVTGTAHNVLHAKSAGWCELNTCCLSCINCRKTMQKLHQKIKFCVIIYVFLCIALFSYVFYPMFLCDVLLIFYIILPYSFEIKINVEDTRLSCTKVTQLHVGRNCHATLAYWSGILT